MGLEKLQEVIGTRSETDMALTNPSQIPRLSLVHPKQTDEEVLLQELADIIESEDGILIP